MNIKDSYIHNGTAVLKDVKVENSVLKKILAGKDANDAYLGWETVCDLTGIKPKAAGTADKVGHKLTFSGGVTGTWDGSADKTVTIPTKSSWNYDDVYLKLTGNETTNPLTGTIYIKDVNGIVLNPNDKDLNIWEVRPNWSNTFGFNLQYIGTGYGNDNDLILWAHNQTGTHVESYRVKQDGTFIFKAAPKVGTNVMYHAGNLTIKTLMGTTAIGDSDEPVYWNGSSFVKAGAYPTKASWNYDDRYLKLAGGTMSNTNVVTNLNADLLDGYHVSSFYKYATASPWGKTTLPWHKIATFSKSTKSTQINTSIAFYISEFYSSKAYGIFTVRARAESNSSSINWLTVDFLVNAGILTSDIVATWKHIGDNNIVINVYAKRSGWSSFSFRKIEEQAWGMPTDDWITLKAHAGNEYCYASIPSDENQVVSTNLYIDNNAVSASQWKIARTITLTGSVTGSVSIDGSSNVTLTTTTNHTHTFDSLTSKPTTIGGYGITDALKIDGSNGTAAGVSALINKLDAGSSTPTDADYYICQYAGGGTTNVTYYRRPMSAMWNWIKAKTNTLYPTKTGSGASGTWGINVTGSATYLSSIPAITTETDITQSGLRIYQGSGSGWVGEITSMTYAAIIALGNPSRGFQLWAQRGTGNEGSLHFRVGNNAATAWESERIILDSINWSSYITSLKNPNTLTAFGVTYDGSSAKTINEQTLINRLVNGDGDCTDNTIMLTSHVNGWSGNSSVIYGRPASKMYNYIKGKLDSIYLPLSGGQMNNTAFIAWNKGSDGNDLADWSITDNGLRIISSVSSTSKAPTQYATGLHVKGRYGFQIASQGGSSSNEFFIKNVHNTIWNTLLHSNNYTSYTVKKDGTGASGTWGISITGNAKTATTSTYASNVGSSGTAGTNYVTASKVISACNWYDTMIGSDSDTVINRWSEIVSFVAGFKETPDLATFLSNNYLAKAGGTMTGPLKWKDNNALPQQTSPQYFLCIDAFDDGGTTKWASKADTLKALTGLTSTAIGDSDEPVYWNGSKFVKAGAYPTKSSWNYDDKYLKLSGGTLTGPVNISAGNIVLTGNEHNNITTKTWGNGTLYNISDSSHPTGLSESASIKNSIRFSWYSTNWVIGNIRGGASNSLGFGICYENSDGTHQLDCFRVSPSGEGYLGGNTIWHSGNLTKVSQLTNDKGYVTSSGVTSIDTGTGLTGGTITSTGTISINSTYQTYISHGENAYNSLSNYYPVLNPAGKWSASGNGVNAYCFIAEINTNGSYINYPITFEIGGRGTITSRVTIRFVNQQAVDPDCNLFVTDEATCYYLYKATTNTWRLYASSPSDTTWGTWYVYRVFGNNASRVTMKMETVNSLPSGYRNVTYTGNVAYASSAGSVAWNNVTEKPTTATRWPSWSEVTNKPSTFPVSEHNHDGRYLRWNGSTADVSAMAWGTLTAANGYTILSHAASSDGGDWGMVNSGGKIYMQLDGYYYQNEGQYRVTDISETVTALGTNGNYLTWTKNGSTSNITVPYATKAGSANSATSAEYAKRLTSNSSTNVGGLSYYYIGGSTFNTTVDGSWSGYSTTTNYNSIVRVQSHTGTAKYYIDLIFDVNNSEIYYRRVTNNSLANIRKIDVYEVPESTASYSLSNAAWTNTITLPTTAGSYILNIVSGNSTLTGVFSIGASDNAKDEISLHLHGNGPRLYARTNGTTLQLSSNDTSATSRSVTIKYRRMI